MISFTDSHFRVIEGCLGEGTFQTPEDLNISVKVILSWGWDEIEKLSVDGPESIRIWQYLLSYALYIDDDDGSSKFRMRSKDYIKEIRMNNIVINNNNKIL